MSEIFTPDPWLSEFFGRPIVQRKVAATDYAQLSALQRQGFRFVAGEVDFCLPLADFRPKTTACTRAQIADITALEALFGEAFGDSRFCAPWFSPAEKKRFYQTWIRRAVRGEFDDLCLVSRAADGRIQGGISLRLQGQQARVGLLAVAPEFQRRGVAGRLLHAAAAWAQQQGAAHLMIATQISNVGALNLYQRLGAQVNATAYWLYLEHNG